PRFRVVPCHGDLASDETERSRAPTAVRALGERASVDRLALLVRGVQQHVVGPPDASLIGLDHHCGIAAALAVEVTEDVPLDVHARILVSGEFAITQPARGVACE